VTDSYLYALCLYTIPNGYTVIKALREQGESILKYAVYATCFIKGFRLLPSYCGTCYRGIVADPTQYNIGNIFVWKSFTSASKVSDIALNFIYKDQITQTNKAILFTIESKSGRSFRDFSCFPDEDEIVFRPFTSFKISNIEQKEITLRHEKIDVYFMTIIEAYPDIRGRKVLVWIDDRIRTNEPNSEFHAIMNNCEKDGVTCVHLHSTQQAKEFFIQHKQLLQRDLDSLRIITDMVRTEEDKKKST